MKLLGAFGSKGALHCNFPFSELRLLREEEGKVKSAEAGRAAGLEWLNLLPTYSDTSLVRLE
ncbi:14666_t:CDS:2, partial [Acaulospora colombiana]